MSSAEERRQPQGQTTAAAQLGGRTAQALPESTGTTRLAGNFL